MDIEISYFGMGVVGGVAFELSLFESWGAFAEYNYGYSPMGKDEKNVDGHQVYFGIKLRR